MPAASKLSGILGVLPEDWRVEEDFIFGDPEGDLLEDLDHFLRWLVTTGKGKFAPELAEPASGAAPGKEQACAEPAQVSKTAESETAETKVDVEQTKSESDGVSRSDLGGRNAQVPETDAPMTPKHTDAMSTENDNGQDKSLTGGLAHEAMAERSDMGSEAEASPKAGPAHREYDAKVAKAKKRREAKEAVLQTASLPDSFNGKNQKTSASK